MIVIVTIAEDIHALAVQERVHAAGDDCHIVECDRIAQRDFLAYGINHDVIDHVLTSDGTRISISKAAVLWLRRMRANQDLDRPLEHERAQLVIDSDCGGALMGLLATHFRGKWISTPDATYRASDKLGQLEVARQCGFAVPRTLVSQSREVVLRFHESCGGRVVVKTIVGGPGPFLQTVALDDPDALDEESFAAAPAIYQERVEGRDHLRLNCFGDKSYAALISSDDLDWRANLDVPITAYEVTAALHRKVRAVLDRLGLEMGIVDLKFDSQGRPIWLEVNPQGQFLFIDAFTDLNLAQRFAEYLVFVQAEVSSGSGPHRRRVVARS